TPVRVEYVRPGGTMPPAESTPFDLPREPLEEAAHRAGELFVEIYRGLEQRPVAPAVDRAALTERFAGTLGDDGVGLLAALDEFRERVLPACMGTPHPLYAASPSRPAGDRLQEELARRVVATGRAWFSTV